jgi:hypothetical protein
LKYEPEDLLSAADIAKISRATPQAVSNWRARHSDFPQPVAGTDRRPLFAYSEVVDWLKQNNKFVGDLQSSQLSFERQIRSFSRTYSKIEILTCAGISLALIKISREIQQKEGLTKFGLAGNAEVVAAMARDGIEEIKNQGREFTDFELAVSNASTEFGEVFHGWVHSSSWREMRSFFVTKYALCEDLKQEFQKLLGVFDSNFPPGWNRSDAFPELQDAVFASFEPQIAAADSVIDLFGGIGNFAFVVARSSDSSKRVVLLQADTQYSAINRARKVFEGVEVEIVELNNPSGLAESILKQKFDFVFDGGAHVESGLLEPIFGSLGIVELARSRTSLPRLGLADQLLMEDSIGVCVQTEESLASRAFGDVLFRSKLLTAGQIIGVLDIPQVPSKQPHMLRTHYLLAIQGKSRIKRDGVTFVSQRQDLAGTQREITARLTESIDLLLELDSSDDGVNVVSLEDLLGSQSQLVGRFYGQYSEAEELSSEFNLEDVHASVSSATGMLLSEAKTMFSGAVHELATIREGVRKSYLKVLGVKHRDLGVDDDSSALEVISRSWIESSNSETARVLRPAGGLQKLGPGDVLVFTDANGVHSRVWKSDARNVLVEFGILILRPNLELLVPEYLAWSLRGRSNSALLGSGGRLRFGIFDKFTFSVPPMENQLALVEKFELIEKIESELSEAQKNLREMKEKIATNLALGGLSIGYSPQAIYPRQSSDVLKFLNNLKEGEDLEG